MACSSICLLLGFMKYHKISLPFVIVKMNCSNKPKKMIMKKKTLKNVLTLKRKMVGFSIKHIYYTHT